MRKWKIGVFCLVILAVGAAVLAKDQLNRKVILLQDGKVIPVNRTWESGSDIFYENDKQTHFVSRADIKSIGTQSLSQVLQASGTDCMAALNRCARYFDPLLQDGAVITQQVKVHPWITTAVLVFGVLLFCVRFVRSRYLKKPAPKKAPVSKEVVPELPGRTDIVRFFLNLYRQQVGAAPEAPAESIQLTAVSAGPNQVYELRVKHGGDWVKRRMTIGPLGEDSGSRSKCYYVIFDQHLVVKIPPKPVRDFEDYVASIKKEGHIVERLAPKECIIPKVSVILSQVHQLSPLMETPAELLEDKYLAWLRKNPEHQDYLKIKGTFVYFMDLSRYYFLSHIIDGFHDLGETFRAEVNSTAELVRYPAKFKERYGDENEAVGFEIRDLYHQCEADIRQLLKNSGKPSAVTAYRIQAWFVAYLEKREIGETDPGLSPELVSGITSIFMRFFEKYREPVDAYTKAIRSFARRLSLDAEPPAHRRNSHQPAGSAGLAGREAGGHAGSQTRQPPGGRRRPTLPGIPAVAGRLLPRIHRRRDGRLFRQGRGKQHPAAPAGGHALLCHALAPVPQLRPGRLFRGHRPVSCISRTGRPSW